MSQRAFLQDFDAFAFASFRDSGPGDDATYYAPGSSAGVPCVVLVDRGFREFGADAAPVATSFVQITFQLAEVSPARGGRVDVDGETYRLDGNEERDGSASRWVVLRA